MLLGTRTTGARVIVVAGWAGLSACRSSCPPAISSKLPVLPPQSSISLPKHTLSSPIPQHASRHQHLPSIHQLSLIVRHHEVGDGPCGLGWLCHRRYAPHAAQEGASFGAARKSSPPLPPWIWRTSDGNLTITTEACRYPAAGRCARPEVHGSAVQVSCRGGLQGAIHCRRHPPCACQQLPECAMYVPSIACALQRSVTAAHPH